MQILDQTLMLLGLNYGEVFSCCGSNHVAHRYHGNEENFVFTEYALHKAIFPADMNKAIANNDVRFLPLAESDFHAIVTGMLTIVRTEPKKRRYLPRYAPDNAEVTEAIVDTDAMSKQYSLF